MADRGDARHSNIDIPRETLDFFNGDELRARVFYEKYTLRDYNGRVLEKSPVEMWDRVASELASVEESDAKRKEWHQKFYSMLENFKFIPGGRILFGAGQNRKVTLLNCYVICVKEDSIEGIFEWCKEAAKTYSYSGGVGTDISILRPRNAPVHNSAMYSTGAVSFMNIMSETTGVIGQAGRRGALMITISVDHPDVLEFIKVKRNLKNVRFANISVRITDEFMQAVEKDADFTLHYESDSVGRIEKKIRARDLWNELVNSARDWAEPGLIFWDSVVRYSPSEYNGMNVISTNPCSEQPLQDMGACDLGHVNLKEFVKNQYTPNAAVMWVDLERTVRYAVRFLDNVLTYNDKKHPLPDQAKACRESRRIGLGVTGLADMLVMLRVKYDSQEGLEFIDQLMDRIKSIAYEESVEIAKEKGPFPLFDAEKHLSMRFIQERLSKELQEKIRAHGLRNVAILTIAPVGSGSVLAGTSSGIEPIFAFSYTRRSESLSQEYFKVYHPSVMEYMKIFNLAKDENLPEYFVPAHRIKADFRVRLQGIVQQHIDSAISSTVNLPEDTTVEDVGEIYMQAWKAGCKGITVYREGSREGVLITDGQQAKNNNTKTQAEKGEWNRPGMMIGQTVKFKLPATTLYVTVNSQDDVVKEVFINIGKSGSEDKSYSEALGRLVSMYLQNGGEIQEVVNNLKGIQGNGVAWDNGIKLLSVPDAIAKAIEAATKGAKQARLNMEEQRRSDAMGKESRPKVIVQTLAVGHGTGAEGGIKMENCPKCHEETLVNEGGCMYCKSCAYSKCD